MINLESLPPIMRRRAEWARQEIMNHPEKSEIDYDEMLAWIFNQEDGLWYSIDGNYSGKSPTEKMDQRNKWLEKQSKNAEIYKKEWDERYYEQQYWSKIRQNVLKRDEYTCQLCDKKGNTKLHIHHILKKDKKGTDFEDNLITVCPSCHSKADRKFYNPKWGRGG